MKYTSTFQSARDPIRRATRPTDRRPATPVAETVVLLHGLARTPLSLLYLEWSLKRQGYTVINQGYPSRRASIEALAKTTIETALANCTPGHQIHFVTHSMGGILLRHYLAHHSIENLGRTVMLGPPNGGCEIVDQLKNVPGFRLINGPAGVELGTGLSDTPSTLGPADFCLGVIAGTRSANLMLARLLPGPNDGKVTVANARLAGMQDFIALPVSHTFMMNNPGVRDQVLHFLEHGEFQQSRVNSTSA